MTRQSEAATLPGGGGGVGAHLRPGQLHDTRTSLGRQVYNVDGRVVGHLTPDGWLVKTGLDPAKHKLRKPEGWATDAAHLDLPGLRGVRLVCTDGSTWEAGLEVWRRYGITIERGHGLQVALPSRFWRVTRPGEARGEQLAFDMTGVAT